MHLSKLEGGEENGGDDEREFRKLFDRYCNYVYTIVFNRLRSCAGREEIEECVCDVFAEVYLHYDSEKAAGGSITGFIGTVARRRASAYFRRSAAAGNTACSDEELPESAHQEHAEGKEEERWTY